MISKDDLRHQILAAREAEPDRVLKSEAIQQELADLFEFNRAETVLSYVGVGSEVATAGLIELALDRGKDVAVPYVTAQGLRAAYIRSIDELEPARFGLLEPPPALRSNPDRDCLIDTVDLFLVPGVAFDRFGGRLGHGKAYYDRLLAGARDDARFVALAFECQVVPRVPMTPTDMHMHLVVTEKGVYRA
jgi:5-formyltetrahydrofolate cyclo-ligase